MAYADPDLRPLSVLDGVFDHPTPTDRLRHARVAGAALRERLLSAAPARFYGAYDLVRVPYPTRYGLRDATWLPTPYMHILNRLFIVQLDGVDGVRTMLVSPSDYARNAETPFFKRLGDRVRWLGGRVQDLIAPPLGTVEGALAEAGIAPEAVDFITYDHLHTQDVRRWLGDGRTPGVLPNARLLVTRQEWTSAQGLLPTQRDWYCPDGIAGVPPERVIVLDGDVMLGDCVALVRTPGHTEGNHSIAVRTPDGVLVTSENGVCADAYAPAHSRIAGVWAHARATGVEVIMNGNTLEGAVHQYVSMVLEKSIAGPCPRDPRFFNCVPSSEMVPSWLFPGLRPTFRFGALRYGAPVTSSARAAARAAGEGPSATRAGASAEVGS